MIAWDWTSARKIPGQGVKQRVQVYVRFSCCISTVPNCTTDNTFTQKRIAIRGNGNMPGPASAAIPRHLPRRRCVQTPSDTPHGHTHTVTRRPVAQDQSRHAPIVRAGRGSCASARCSPSTSRGRCMVHPRPAAASSPVTRPSQARFQLALPRRETLVAGVDLT